LDGAEQDRAYRSCEIGDQFVGRHIPQWPVGEDIAAEPIGLYLFDVATGQQLRQFVDVTSDYRLFTAGVEKRRNEQLFLRLEMSHHKAVGDVCASCDLADRAFGIAVLAEYRPCRREDRRPMGFGIAHPLALGVGDPMALKPQGTLSVVGVPESAMRLGAFELLFSEKKVSGGEPASRQETVRMLDFAARTGVRPKVETFAMSDINKALARVRAGEARYRAVVAS
jgi:hypothetical protein